MAVWDFLYLGLSFWNVILLTQELFVCASAKSNLIFLNTKTICPRESSARVIQVILLDLTKYKNRFSPQTPQYQNDIAKNYPSLCHWTITGRETIESRKVPKHIYYKKAKFYFFVVTTISICLLIPQLKKKGKCRKQGSQRKAATCVTHIGTWDG